MQTTTQFACILFQKNLFFNHWIRIQWSEASGFIHEMTATFFATWNWLQVNFLQPWIFVIWNEYELFGRMDTPSVFNIPILTCIINNVIHSHMQMRSRQKNYYYACQNLWISHYDWLLCNQESPLLVHPWQTISLQVKSWIKRCLLADFQPYIGGQRSHCSLSTKLTSWIETYVHYNTKVLDFNWTNASNHVLEGQRFRNIRMVSSNKRIHNLTERET